MPTARVANPFILIVNPQAVFDSIASSERLERLQRRVCHPLDKVLMPAGLASEASSGESVADELQEADATS
jgi:hypothetical protein